MSEIIEAYVHKSMIPTLDGESIDDFRTNLSNALRSTVSLGKNDSLYVVEIFGDQTIYSLYRETGSIKSSLSPYWLVNYTRDSKSGEFSFSNSNNVRRKETFVPVGGLTVTKNLDPKEAQEIHKSMWKKISLFEGIV